MEIRAYTEIFQMEGTFTISRGSRTQAEVVTVEIRDGEHIGRGECVPYKRYGETLESVVEQIQTLAASDRAGLDNALLQGLMSAGAARNAVDCALWDLEAKRRNAPVFQLLDMDEPQPVTTAYTLSLDNPDRMQASAEKNAARPLLKMKLGGEGDLDRVAAVRTGAPESRIIVDANEAWTKDNYLTMVPRLVELGVEMIEQPFPAGDDLVLKDLDRPIPICADESCHDRHGLEDLIGRYDMVNIKLDKTGGLTEAMALKAAARSAGFSIMVGCMVGTSLAMAPALLVAQGVELVDLDGPLLLAEDRDQPLHYEQSWVSPASRQLWG